MTQTPYSLSSSASIDVCRNQIAPVLEVKNLRKTYGKLVAVSEVSFSVFPKQVFCLVGPNGSGKTSIIDCILGLKKPDLGDVFIFGERCRNLLRRKDLLSRIGIQFQEDSLYSDIRVSEALSLYANMYETPVDPDELLKVFELETQHKRAYKDLSGGERRRLQIAIALVGDPELLFLDEPASNLDPDFRRKMWTALNLFRSRGLTIVMTTHDMDEAQRESDEVCLVNRGRIIASGTVQYLLGKFHLDQKVEIEAEVSAEDFHDCSGVTHIDRDSHGICVYGTGDGFEESVVTRLQGVGVTEFAVRPSDLKDVFFFVTGRRYMRCAHTYGKRNQECESLIIQGKDVLQAALNESDVDKIYAARKLFERVIQYEEYIALAWYYIGLTDYRLATQFVAQTDDNSTRLACINQAISHIKKAIELNDRFSDAYALLAGAYQQKIGMKHYLGMFLGSKSKRLIEKAKQLEGDNPRVLFLDALSDYFTPTTWGGDKQRAVEKFKRVAELFSEQEIGNPILPSWGHDEVYAWLGIIRQWEGDIGGARKAFAKALEVNPDNGWVRYVLLPGLKG
ncbi:MAG: ATP-binding cassette domain-containing protein [Gemmatimonadota bacterium]|nr:ATP-binding cassette domain-containing protein [Gemmatimonadota bacterium]